MAITLGNKFQQVVIFSLLTVFGIANGHDGEDPLKTFLTLAMQDFPAWLQLHDYDPFSFSSEAIPFSENSGTTNVTGELRVQRIIQRSDFCYSVLGNLYGDFDVKVGLQLEAVGEYIATGTLFGSLIPVLGEGNFTCKDNTTTNIGFLSSVRFYAWDFGINSEGFIDLTVGGSGKSSYLFAAPSWNLEGLSAGSFANETVEDLMTESARKLDLSFSDYVEEYVREILGKVPVSEIIQITLPLSTTVMYGSTTDATESIPSTPGEETQPSGSDTWSDVTERNYSTSATTPQPNISTTSETSHSTRKEGDWTIMWFLKKIQITKFIFTRNKSNSNSTLLLDDDEDNTD